MKKILILLILCGCNFITISQTIDDVDIREIPSKFVEVVFNGNSNLYGVFKPIKINYGFNEKLKVFRKKTNVIYEGEKVVLKTENDVINFFTSFGFEVVNEMDRSKSYTSGYISGGGGFISGGTRNQVVIRFQNNNNLSKNRDKENAKKKELKKIVDRCGERPVKPPSFNNRNYKTSTAYKNYKKALKKWEACIAGD